MTFAMRPEEIPDFRRLAYACTLMAQAVIMGIVRPITDGRLKAWQEELNRAFDAKYGNRSYSMEVVQRSLVQRSRDAHDALIVAYTERDESYNWETDCRNWTIQEQRWAIDPRFFDKETDVGWKQMHLLEMYIDEVCPGQRNFDPDRFYELPPDNLKAFDWQRPERLKPASHTDSQPVEKTEAAAAASPSRHDPAGSMVAMEDDPKWCKAQALVDDRLAAAITKYELETKSLPKQP